MPRLPVELRGLEEVQGDVRDGCREPGHEVAVIGYEEKIENKFEDTNGHIIPHDKSRPVNRGERVHVRSCNCV